MPFTSDELKELAGIFASTMFGSYSLPDQPSSLDGAAAINAVRVRLPKFLDFNPELWFAQCEAVFDLSRVTSEKTKFNHCIAGLEPEVLRKVQSFIRNPDDTQPYTKFKEGLLRATVKPVPQRLQDIMDLRLGDRRPSDLLHLMQEAWPEPNSEDSLVFRQFFLQKLPPSLQPGLSSSSLEMTDLALLADTQVASLRALNPQVGHSSPSLSAAVCPSSHDLGNSDWGMQAPQDVLVARQQAQWRGQQRRPAPFRSSPSHKPGEWCWYHKKWGVQAQKCHRMGCSFRRSENGPGAHQQ